RTKQKAREKKKICADSLGMSMAEFERLSDNDEKEQRMTWAEECLKRDKRGSTRPDFVRAREELTIRKEKLAVRRKESKAFKKRQNHLREKAKRNGGQEILGVTTSEWRALTPCERKSAR